MQTATCSKQSQMIYRPRRPEKTVLFGVIKKHYRTWRKNLKYPLPGYVQKTFEKYLDCGNPAKGFAWLIAIVSIQILRSHFHVSAEVFVLPVVP